MNDDAKLILEAYRGGKPSNSGRKVAISIEQVPKELRADFEKAKDNVLYSEDNIDPDRPFFITRKSLEDCIFDTKAQIQSLQHPEHRKIHLPGDVNASIQGYKNTIQILTRVVDWMVKQNVDVVLFGIH